MRLGKTLFFLWLFALAQGAQAVAAPRENAFQYDECVSAASFEYWDQDAQLVYLRARWYDPRIGRFISADPYEGKQSDPRSLNRYAFAHSDPVHGRDPSGLAYTSEIGNWIEAAVQVQYERSHPLHVVSYGGIQFTLGYWAPQLYFKPDIFNVTMRAFNEIKPLSPSGVAHGITQMGYYAVTFIPQGYAPDPTWTPRPVTLNNGRRYCFINTDGPIFYSDDCELARRAALVPVSSLRSFLNSNLAKINTSDFENSVIAGRNNAVTAATVGLAAAIVATVVIRSF